MTRDDVELERKFATRTLPEQVAEELGAEIVAGRRKSGERLIELELAQHFGLRRGPIREAIRILERRRLVDFNPRRGAYVRPLSLKSVADLFDVRIALSLLAARTMATARAGPWRTAPATNCSPSNLPISPTRRCGRRSGRRRWIIRPGNSAAKPPI